MVLDLITQLDRECTERNKIEVLLRELLDARRNRKSEQLSPDQLALFAAAWQARQAEAEPIEPDGSDEDDPNANPGGGESASKKRTGGRQPLPRHRKRERIVHDLAEAEKHCSICQQDLRPIGEESSERYEYIPAKLTVIEDICKKYACACTVKTATKPSQPIEKSTAGASLLAQVIVAKTADHLPLHRQEKIFERHGVDISRKTMGGWLAQCADLLKPLYGSMKEVLFQSKVIGTDDTSVKVLDVKLPFARTGRIWPYSGDAAHPVILYDYTATRERAGPEEFLKGYRGYLQADAYGGYDAFFKDPARGLIEVGCWAHARRYFHKALESDQPRMGPAISFPKSCPRLAYLLFSIHCRLGQSDSDSWASSLYSGAGEAPDDGVVGHTRSRLGRADGEHRRQHDSGEDCPRTSRTQLHAMRVTTPVASGPWSF